MKTLKKLSAILLSVMLLAALLPANLAFAGTGDTLPVFYNFDGDADVSDTGDFSIHNATYEISADSVYGKTLKVSGESGKVVQIRYRGTENTCYSATGSLTIKTAIKKYDTNINTGLRFGPVTAVQPIVFNKDGYIYIAGVKTPYIYKTNVWYEVTMTVNHNTGYTESIINGGDYKNLVLSGYSDELLYPESLSNKHRAFIGAYDGSATGASTIELGYFSVSEGTLTGASYTDDFENSTSNDKYIGGFYNSYGSERFSREENSINGNNYMNVKAGNTYRDMKELTLDGKYMLSMSIKPVTGALVYLKDTDGKDQTTLIKFNTSNNIVGQGATANSEEDLEATWSTQWYDVIFTLDMKNIKYDVSIFDESGTEVVTKTGLTLFNTTGVTRRIFLKQEGSGSAYYDNISLSVAGETIRRQSMSPAPAAKGVFVSEEPTVSFTQKLDASTVDKDNVELSTDDGVYDDYTPTVSADGKSIVIKHTNPLAENTKFTVKINGVKSKTGDAVAAYSYSFTTAKAYEIGTVSFGDATAETTGDITASVNIKFNDDEAHEVVFITAVYDKTSGELVTCDIDNRKGDTAVTGTDDLTATVTVPDDEKTYEVIAYLWDGIGTLRPYIAATPLK